MNFTIRKARVEDCAKLAALMNVAGEGLPAFLWKRMADPGEDFMAFGARRVARKEGGFSYRNAWVATSGDTIAGMLLGYPLADPYEAGPLDEIPDIVRPLVELESMAPGSWYVNALATDLAHRRLGVGRKLMERAEQLADASKAAAISLIVADENAPARALYERLGYQSVARRPIVPYPQCPHNGDWILMKKEIT